ncbi:MAG: response regulator [Flavobacteriales bacterium]|nr:response regulator [Flavobacteriales bacterium]
MNSRENVDVLLVEDSEYDAEMALMSLVDNKVSNNNLWVKDGEQALEYLFGSDQAEGTISKKWPKLILLDIKMPKVNGLQVLEAIRTDERTKHIPVVMLTSSKESRDLAMSYDLGVNSYIVKPVEFDRFEKAVSEIGHYWLSLNQPRV